MSDDRFTDERSGTTDLLRRALDNAATSQLVDRVWELLTPEQKVQLTEYLIPVVRDAVHKELKDGYRISNMVQRLLEEELKPTVQQQVRVKVAEIETNLREHLVEQWDRHMSMFVNNIFQNALREVQNRFVDAITGAQRRLERGEKL